MRIITINKCLYGMKKIEISGQIKVRLGQWQRNIKNYKHGLSGVASGSNSRSPRRLRKTMFHKLHPKHNHNTKTNNIKPSI